MDVPDHDERIRRLQRTAYGGVASDAERAEALAQLEALRREQAADEAAEDAAAVEAPVDDPSPVVERTPTGSTRATADWIAASDAASVRRFRWAVALGTAALLVGVAVGWQLGTRTDDASITLEASAALPDLTLATTDSVPVPIASSAALGVFDREQSPADSPAAIMQDDIDPATLRLLVTRPDGVAAYAALTHDGSNACVVIAFPPREDLPEGAVAAGTGSTCTRDGTFPADGLTVDFSLEGRGAVHATWSPDGSASISSADARLPGTPVANG